MQYSNSSTHLFELQPKATPRLFFYSVLEYVLFLAQTVKCVWLEGFGTVKRIVIVLSVLEQLSLENQKNQ
jgi:hypothetical protein